MKDIIESLPDNWKVMKFRQIFSLRKGLSITKEDLLEEGCPVISYGQVHSKENTGIGINQTLIRFVSEKYLYTDKISIVEPGDFIFADTSEDTDGVGNCVFVDFKSTLFAGYHTIIVHPTILECYPLYFAFLFLTDFWRANLRAKVMGVKVFSITQKLLRETFVILPPVYEQRAIADFLDKECAQIDSIAADLEKQIELLQQYKKSLITETVTKGLDKSVPMKDSGVEWIGQIPEHWELKHLKYLTKSILDGTHLTPTYTDDGIPFLRVTDITSVDGIDAEINLDSVARISKEEHRILCQRCHPQKGDVLVSKNGTIGVPKIIDWDWEFSIFVSLCLIKLNESLLNKWLFYYFKSTLVATEIAFAGKTNTITNLHLEKIANFKIPLPSVEEQKLIATYLDEKVCRIDALIKEKQNQLSIIRQHKKSLIYEYVTGKKRVKGVQ